MRHGQNHLFVPGPTNIPDPVLNAMHVSAEDHRAPDFPDLVKPLLQDLNKVFKTTRGQSFIFPATGTAGWEVALTNTLSPGDKILTSRFGQFSHLWIDMARRLGLDVEVVEVPWGEGAPVVEFEERLAADANHEIKAVLVVHNETATGVTSDVAGVRRAMNGANHPALLFVDGVSSVASIDFRMDEWEVDMAVSGSQKGFMMPAGLAMVAASPKALAARETAKLPRCFLDLEDQIKANADGYFPYTPSAQLLRGLRQSLDLLFAEGLENVFKRHHRLGEGVRRAVQAWGLDICAQRPEWYSDTITAVMVPAGINSADVQRAAYYRYNLSLGGGLNDVAGKLFRIGHLSHMNDASQCGALAGVEMALQDCGIDIEPGSGVAAAMKYYREHAPSIEQGESTTPANTV